MLHFVSNADKRRRSAGENIEAGIVVWSVIVGFLIFFTGVALFLMVQGRWSARIGAGATAIGLCVGAVGVGTALGFIFGLPRSAAVDPVDAERAENRPHAGTHFLVNSNLLKVSDWLTTILIGLGLVQLGSAAPAVSDFVDTVERHLGGDTGTGAFTVAMMGGAAIAAIVMSYLWTSIRVRELFEQVEHDEEHDLRSAFARSVIEEAKTVAKVKSGTIPPRDQLIEDLPLFGRVATDKERKQMRHLISQMTMVPAPERELMADHLVGSAS